MAELQEVVDTLTEENLRYVRQAAEAAGAVSPDQLAALRLAEGRLREKNLLVAALLAAAGPLSLAGLLAAVKEVEAAGPAPDIDLEAACSLLGRKHLSEEQVKAPLQVLLPYLMFNRVVRFVGPKRPLSILFAQIGLLEFPFKYIFTKINGLQCNPSKQCLTSLPKGYCVTKKSVWLHLLRFQNYFKYLSVKKNSLLQFRKSIFSLFPTLA